MLLVKQAKFEAAEGFLRKVLTARRLSSVPGQSSIVHSMMNLAECLRLNGQFSESADLFGETVQMIEKGSVSKRSTSGRYWSGPGFHCC
jgi:hypothetical protein